MEYWDIYDGTGVAQGYCIPKNQPLQPGEYHLAMEAWIFNHAFEVLLQQRSSQCELLPNLWGLTTGRIVAGETSAQGCLREIKEELGITIDPARLIFLRRLCRGDGSGLIWDLYVVPYEAPLTAFTLQPEEVCQVRWVTLETLRDLVAQGAVFQYPEIYDLIGEFQAQRQAHKG